MNVSKRTKLSLVQFLGLFDDEINSVFFEKYDIHYKDDWDNIMPIKDIILQLDIQQKIASIIIEIIQTQNYLKNKACRAGVFYERLQDLKSCLLLDGFKVDDKEIISIEPFIEANVPIEDDLTKLITESSLPKAEQIIEHIKRSAQLFLQSNPDYNGCLTNARIALETLVRDIAESKGFSNTFGHCLNHLKTIQFLNEKEEKTIGSIYGFVSDGAHISLGFTEEEYTRFGRNLITSMCYFISKKLVTNINT